ISNKLPSLGYKFNNFKNPKSLYKKDLEDELFCLTTKRRFLTNSKKLLDYIKNYNNSIILIIAIIFLIYFLITGKFDDVVGVLISRL
ncbi:MAG: hypothetical protein JW700_04220, partial [Candidatus Aenigmarchaeota archaeon]|nr:hypothetical protein [Candidatus Aenigmarchaeota archaeon]